MRKLLLLLAAGIPATLGASSAELWDHLPMGRKLAETRGLSARFEPSGARRVLKLEVPKIYLAPGETVRDSRRGIAWVSLPPPAEGWDLGGAEFVEASVRNTGAKAAQVTLWVVSSNGWAAVGGAARVPPNESTTLRANLRETYPDGTPKIDPGRVREIRVMIQRVGTASLVVSGLVAAGSAAPWVRPAGHLEVPDMEDGKPAPGKRVRYHHPGDGDEEIYGALYLPPDWKPGKRYPVIVEFPGNLFFSASKCWSTGRPEQCVMGYGISNGKGAIWVSLPFVDRPNGTIAEIGFGSNDGDDTAAYTMQVVEDLCTRWGGDRGNLHLSGFSRGAIACGYIGLRNGGIAPLWKGFIACQHYDGSGWNKSTMEGAVARAPRFGGVAIFQVDNSLEKYQPVVDATDPAVKWTWVESGLGYHAAAMFLDDRPAMIQLRRWFGDLVE